MNYRYRLKFQLIKKSLKLILNIKFKQFVHKCRILNSHKDKWISSKVKYQSTQNTISMSKVNHFKWMNQLTSLSSTDAYLKNNFLTHQRSAKNCTWMTYKRIRKIQMILNFQRSKIIFQWTIITSHNLIRNQEKLFYKEILIRTLT